MKKGIKRAIAMVLTLIFLLLPATIAYADTACIVTGTKNYLALRTEPRTDSRNEIGKLYNGDTFYVTSNSGGFAYGYTVQGRYGYVNANYLRVANYQPQAAPVYTPTPPPTYQPQYQPVYGDHRIVTGTKNYLALRSSAVRSDSNEIGRLHNGDSFWVTQWGSTGFAYGYTASGQYGYVVSAYLR